MQNGIFQERMGGRELSSQNGSLPIKTGELEYMRTFMKVYYRILLFLFTLARFLEWINTFLQKTISPSFKKTGNLQVFELYLPKCLCLEYA